MTAEVTIEDSTVEVTIDDSTIEISVENNEVSVDIAVAVSLDDIADFIHTGSTSSFTPTIWTGHHQFDFLIGGVSDDSFIYANTLGIGLSGVSLNAGGALAGVLVSRGKDFSVGTETKIIGSSFSSSILELYGVPTIGIASPFQAFDATLYYDPVLDGGSPVTWPDSRVMDAETTVVSGAIEKSHSITSRVRVKAAGTINNHTGFTSYGYNGNDQTDSDGDIGDYIGFHAGQDERINWAMNGTMTNYLGFRADMPTDFLTVTNKPEAFWCNGDYEDFGSAIPFGIMFGVNKEDKIYHSRTFTAGHRMTIETSAIEFKDNGVDVDNPLVDVVGSTSGIPVLARLPENSTGAGAMKWVRVLLGTSAYYLPMFSSN